MTCQVPFLKYGCAHIHNVWRIRFLFWSLGVLTSTMYGAYGSYSEVWVCSHPQCIACTVPFLKYGCAHIHNVWRVRFPFWSMSVLTSTMYGAYGSLSEVWVCTSTLYGAYGSLSEVWVCSHPHCVVRTVPILKYGCAHIHNMWHVWCPFWSMGVLTSTMYGVYGSLSEVWVCTSTLYGAYGSLSEVWVCSYPQRTARTVPFLRYGCAHIHNVWRVRFPFWNIGVLTSTLYGAYCSLSEVWVSSHPQCMARVVPILKYGCAHFHNLWRIRFPFWSMGLLTSTMYSAYSSLSDVCVCSHLHCMGSTVPFVKYGGAHIHTVWCVWFPFWSMGVLTSTMYGTYGSLSEVWVCSHLHCRAHAVPFQKYGCAHIHNVWRIRFPFWSMGVLTSTVYDAYGSLSKVWVCSSGSCSDVWVCSCLQCMTCQVPFLQYGCAHIHNVWHIWFLFWSMSVLTFTMYHMEGSISEVWVCLHLPCMIRRVLFLNMGLLTSTTYDT